MLHELEELTFVPVTNFYVAVPMVKMVFVEVYPGNGVLTTEGATGI